MNKTLDVSNGFNDLVEDWAVGALGSIGVVEGKIADFEKLKKKVIDQLRSVYTDKAIEKFLKAVDNRKIDFPEGYGKVTGPCGDTMEIYLKIADGKIIDASFQTDGCNPSMAAGGMMVEMVKGVDIEKAGELTQQDVLNALGGLPEENRHCALLAVDTLKQALKNMSGKVAISGY